MELLVEFGILQEVSEEVTHFAQRLVVVMIARRYDPHGGGGGGEPLGSGGAFGAGGGEAGKACVHENRQSPYKLTARRTSRNDMTQRGQKSEGGNIAERMKCNV